MSPMPGSDPIYSTYRSRCKRRTNIFRADMMNIRQFGAICFCRLISKSVTLRSLSHRILYCITTILIAQILTYINRLLDPKECVPQRIRVEYDTRLHESSVKYPDLAQLQPNIQPSRLRYQCTQTISFSYQMLGISGFGEYYHNVEHKNTQQERRLKLWKSKQRIQLFEARN